MSSDIASTTTALSSALLDILASASTTASLLSASASASLGDVATATASVSDGTVGNGTTVFDGGMADPNVDLGSDGGSYILNTFIGLLIVLVSSVFNALGLNLTKLDHIKQKGIPRRQRKKEYLRVLWLSGMGMYITHDPIDKTTVGSPLALRYLRPDWVAPLGSSSLVFNFLFAYWLVGTPVTATDIRGTAVIIIGVILIIVFSSINHGLIQSLPIERLNFLWSRGAWIAYFIFIILFTASTYIVSSLFKTLLRSRASFSPLPSPSLELPTSRSPSSPNFIVKFYQTIKGTWERFERMAVGRLEILFQRTGDERVVWLQGIGWGVAGGSLAGLCLVFTKAAVKMMGLPGHPFLHPSSLISLICVIVTAIFQIVCLNRALECADTVVVVPLFYAGYTVFGFINSLIFYDEAGQYATWVLVAVFMSIGVLILGVVLLSLKSSAKTESDPYTVGETVQAGGSMRLRPRAPKMSTEEGHDEDHEDGHESRAENVLWEVGSASDQSDDENEENAQKNRGVGGVKGGTGERRGLLGEEEEDRHEGDEEGDKRNPFEEGDDGFGEYAGVGTDDEREGKGK
ncbi:hypothetical protein I350_00387 [Cryptococcus amylolentus CBS 6273]|uniref:Uncharacterized protein n=1 Tax=Cryptococcus amylolentus CBS 6273 TaxID=1296118 RepID=A0A1E3KF13_9TREE|nr:hypothetical protein I350_00387 [Cryptococcus amylolentus CBS 6273]